MKYRWALKNNNNNSANNLLKEIGKKISLNTGESTEVSFLYQHISMLGQRFNAILLHETLPTVGWLTECHTHNCLVIHNFNLPTGTPTEDLK